MKIAYFVNSFDAINWGGQATSNGIKVLVEKTYPNATFVPLDLPSFPFDKIRIIRTIWEKKLANSILVDERGSVIKYLKKLNIDESFFEGFDTVCFNGEGAIHSKSGHLIRLMGMLYEFKKRGAFVSALNQTVDLGNNKLIQDVVKKVYSMVDYLAVREPVSQRELQKLGLNPELVADAAYALGSLSKEEVEELTSDLNLPQKFVAVTGSSYLKRSRKSIKLMDKLLAEIRNFYKDIPIYFLANAKTDMYIAKKLKSKYRFTIFGFLEKYDKAMAVIAKAYVVIGGRQHPNIFAAMQGVPFVPLKGNTHKMEGVIELIKYPMNVLDWNDFSNFKDSFQKLELMRINLYDVVNVPKLETIRLSL
ncbi:MAG: polysaccharide pyruvyl transferase family protein [Campylobacterales bacterium]|nr:polysaccharide pyruvyl transferase family protein [Flavobacteriaceae bacterium]MBD3824516.1 polysaccharide pyruvyl transferase family protein [Campylobacterota bacterium]MBD3829004.1 polysaccharide pyruvyl transferase family protein [Arcobacter sp.]MBD3841891.1 polysaccharide pyruvyl transferase family protein [Campylobacterales bacterium]